VNLVSEDGKIELQSETSFFVIPWKTTLSILALLFIIWLIPKFFGKKAGIKRKK
jgi:hypothetical protein